MGLDDPGASPPIPQQSQWQLCEEERKDDRPEDREDDTDLAIKLAREYVLQAVGYLAAVMLDERKLPDERIRSATTLLEVAGCL